MEKVEYLLKNEMEDLGFVLSMHGDGFPINSLEIAETFGFEIFKGKLESKSNDKQVAMLIYNSDDEGVLETFGTDKVILYDANSSEEEVRIAVGDLLMNFFADNKDNYDDEGLITTKNYLILSSIYPEHYELVMPANEFLIEYSINVENEWDFDEIVNNIAYYFGVPVYSVIDRMASLQLDVPKCRINVAKDIHKLILNCQSRN